MQKAFGTFLVERDSHKAVPIDFPGFLTSCEMNFHKLLKVFPMLLTEDNRIIEMHCMNEEKARLQLQVQERTAHTSMLLLRLFDQSAYFEEAHMFIRVYHDMKVVEVLSIQSIDVRKSSISVSPHGIFQPTERLQASILLSDWLGHCLHFGTVPFTLEAE